MSVDILLSDEAFLALRALEHFPRKAIQNIKIGLVQNSFCFRGSASWNSLPESLRLMTKIGPFKTGLKKWILKNIPRFHD